MISAGKFQDFMIQFQIFLNPGMISMGRKNTIMERNDFDWGVC